MAKVSRVNISVPVDLKERMMERKDINFSAVAVRAFRKALDDEGYTDEMERLQDLERVVCKFISSAEALIFENLNK